MTIYSIQTNNSIWTSADFKEILKIAVKLSKKRKTATICKDGNKIGWVGKDLTQRLGWGFYIEKNSY